jgi:hypothetical protein
MSTGMPQFVIDNLSLCHFCARKIGETLYMRWDNSTFGARLTLPMKYQVTPLTLI